MTTRSRSKKKRKASVDWQITGNVRCEFDVELDDLTCHLYSGPRGRKPIATCNFEYPYGHVPQSIMLMDFKSSRPGSGKKLFCATLAHLKKLKFKRMYLAANTGPRNDINRLLRYYRKLGFRSVKKENPKEMKSTIDNLIDKCNRVHPNIVDNVSLTVRRI